MSAAAKNHPIGGYISVVVISVLLGLLFKLFNSSDLVGYICAAIFLVWGVIALALFGRGDSEAEAAQHH